MNRIVLLAAVAAASGCGFPLTPGAVLCGEHKTGMEIWVDGTGTNEKTGRDYMTCDQAMETVDQAIAVGVANGFWDREPRTFLSGIRLEMIGDETLTVIGFPEANGRTTDVFMAHVSAVAYGNDDQSVDYSKPYVVGQETWPSAVILAHEMTHMWQSEGFLDLGAVNNDSEDHCHWASEQAPKYATLGWSQFSSNFNDKCEHRQCSGATCKDN